MGLVANVYLRSGSTGSTVQANVQLGTGTKWYHITATTPSDGFWIDGVEYKHTIEDLTNLNVSLYNEVIHLIETSGTVKNNPLIIGDGCVCIIANPSKWVDMFDPVIAATSKAQATPDLLPIFENVEWLTENNVKVEGCTITFPDEYIRMLFSLKFGS